MRSARVRALRKSILELVLEAESHSSGLVMDYLDEVKELVNILCDELDEDEPEELNFD